MTTFTAGPNGGNALTILNAGTSSRQTVSPTEIDTYYTSGQELVFYGSFSVNSGGTSISGGTVTSMALYGANGLLNWTVTGANADVQTVALDSQLGLTNAITQLFFPYHSTYVGSTNPNASDLLTGSGGDTYIGGAATELFEPAGGINTIKGGTGSNTVQFVGTFSGYSFSAGGGSNFTITDSISSRNGVVQVSGVQSLKFSDVVVSASGNLLALPATSAAQALFWSNEIAGSTAFAPLKISDSSANVVNQLPSLESLATSGKLGAITLTNSGTVTLNLTAAQVSSDISALQQITSPAIIDVSAATANTSFSGPGDPGTVVLFSGKASQYSVTPTGGGGVTVVDTGTGRSSADHFSNITALQFSDQTDFIASAPSSAGATSGNITELYSAAFGRQPDVGGLAYYEQILKNAPSTPLTQFAQNFLASAEYTNAHNYAQSTSGDTQFISDLYNNLLHRAPESGAVPFYLGLINQITAGTTQGTTAYTNALANAHAVVLTDLSQSPEFVGNVQITGSGSNAGHWLILS